MKTIATHNGSFHADEVFAFAILKLIHPDVSFVRTRNPEILKKCDARIDVGMKYNPKTNDYDHHQSTFKKIRSSNKVPYSSAGLIWKHFGLELVNSKEAWTYIDEKLICPIDAGDNGFNIYEKTVCEPYVLNTVIRSFNPTWVDTFSETEGFKKAVKFAIEIIKREIKKANSLKEADKIVKDSIAKFKNKKYFVLEQFCPWKRYTIKHTKKQIIIYEAKDHKWMVQAVPTSIDGFENRIDLPKKWGGLQDKDLAKVSGIKDAVFCHKNLFLGAAKSKESAIKMAEIALKKK